MNWRRLKHHLFFKQIKRSRELLVPLVLFQFVRTLLLPTAIDVLILGGIAFAYLAVQLDWL
ncbi:hypothetical protein [Brevibacillus daliensis]|uniref:hypothetical protein n=1 Tax=Brevibacillus daliensis TaxID=2892995 RepID=UPI001E447D67|nr:hypothetical protein [Brevibacillus daliensis]